MKTNIIATVVVEERFPTFLRSINLFRYTSLLSGYRQYCVILILLPTVATKLKEKKKLGKKGTTRKSLLLTCQLVPMSQ